VARIETEAAGTVSIYLTHVDQVRDHRCVVNVARFAVLFGIAIEVRFEHVAGIVVDLESHDVHAVSRPTAMKVQRMILPIDEPLVFHLFGNQSQLDALHLVWRKCPTQADGSMLGWQCGCLPVSLFGWCHDVGIDRIKDLAFKSSQSSSSRRDEPL